MKTVVCRDIGHEQGQEIQRQNSESEQIRTLVDRQKEQILADCHAEIQKHEFQADYDRRSFQKLNGVIESQRGEVNRALARDEQLRRDQQLLHSRSKKNFIVLKQKNAVDKIINFFMNSY